MLTEEDIEKLRDWLAARQVRGWWIRPADIINVLDNLEAGTYEV